MTVDDIIVGHLAGITSLRQMGMGGHIGSQTSTIAARGLAAGRTASLGQCLGHQIWVGAILGLACSAVVAALFLEKNVYYAVVVGAAVFLAIAVAAANGALIPLLFRRLGLDPAAATGHLVSTTNNITGILISFGLASLLIDSLVR